MYATLGPGLHARREMSPIVALKIWKTHVLPRCLYGIEILNYLNVQLSVCKQIQGLPKRTANTATYALLGVEPIQTVVD